MKTNTKRGTMLALAALMLFMSMFVPFEDAEAEMMYNNTTNALLSCSIDENADLSAILTVYGKQGKTTRINVELYVEKQFLGIFWYRIDIGCTNNIWTDSTTQYYYNNTFTTHLNSHGTYRVTVTYTVSGTGGADDIITKTSTIIY